MISFGGKSGPNQQPADWYPDPLRRADLRYWDGTKWTSHVSTGGTSYDEGATAPGLALPPPTQPSTASRSDRATADWAATPPETKRMVITVFVAVGAVFVLTGIVALVIVTQFK